MRNLFKILRSLHFFGHLTSDEIIQLASCGKTLNLKGNSEMTAEKDTSLCVVVSGLLSAGGVIPSEAVYMNAGSYFGRLPFASRTQSGRVRALCDSIVFVLSEDDIRRFFLFNFKAYRGYIRILERTGFKVDGLPGYIPGSTTRVISVYGNSSVKGKTLIATLVAEKLSETGNTVLLDASSTGKSAFEYLGLRLTPPISERRDDSVTSEYSIAERIQRVNDTFSLLNVSHFSKVAVDSSILSPVLFRLGFEYSYIVMDLSDDDPELRDRALSVSDYVFAVGQRTRDFSSYDLLFDRAINSGQRIYHILNMFNAKPGNDTAGYLFLEDYSKSGKDAFSAMRGEGACSAFASAVSSEKRALVIQPEVLSSLYYVPFIAELYEGRLSYDKIYSSAFSSILVSLFLVSSGRESFYKAAISFFSEAKLASYIDIVFPDRFVFRSSGIASASSGAAGRMRAEMFKTLPVVKLSSISGEDRLFSTGSIATLMASSFQLSGLFEPVELAGGLWRASYPERGVTVADAFRADVDRVDFVSLNDSLEVNTGGMGVLRFYLDHVSDGTSRRMRDSSSCLAERCFEINPVNEAYNPEKMIINAEKATTEILQKIC